MAVGDPTDASVIFSVLYPTDLFKFRLVNGSWSNDLFLCVFLFHGRFLCHGILVITPFSLPFTVCLIFCTFLLFCNCAFHLCNCPLSMIGWILSGFLPSMAFGNTIHVSFCLCGINVSRKRNSCDRSPSLSLIEWNILESVQSM